MRSCRLRQGAQFGDVRPDNDDDMFDLRLSQGGENVFEDSALAQRQSELRPAHAFTLAACGQYGELHTSVLKGDEPQIRYVANEWTIQTLEGLCKD
jgi:hypothetical protein